MKATSYRSKLASHVLDHITPIAAMPLVEPSYALLVLYIAIDVLKLKFWLHLLHSAQNGSHFYMACGTH